MRTIYLFWLQYNWLEFITYILIPTSIVLIILVYLFFNIELLKVSLNLEFDIIDKKHNVDFEHFKFDFEYANEDLINSENDLENTDNK